LPEWRGAGLNGRKCQRTFVDVDPLIRRSRLNCATQAQIISPDIRFIPSEHGARSSGSHLSFGCGPERSARYQYGLKIWDAYRPAAVQAKLWQALHNSDYVANPEIGVGSLHSWGIAVDATLVTHGIAMSACQRT
jgi:hypothetical protein